MISSQIMPETLSPESQNEGHIGGEFNEAPSKRGGKEVTLLFDVLGKEFYEAGTHEIRAEQSLTSNWFEGGEIHYDYDDAENP